MTFKPNNTAYGMGEQLPGPAPLWHRWCGMATPPVMRKLLSQQNTFLKLFLVQNKLKDMGCGAVEARLAVLPRPQIMAMLSGAQLR